MKPLQRRPQAVKINRKKRILKSVLDAIERIVEMFVAGGFVAIVFSSTSLLGIFSEWGGVAFLSLFICLFLVIGKEYL